VNHKLSKNDYLEQIYLVVL